MGNSLNMKVWISNWDDGRKEFEKGTLLCFIGNPNYPEGIVCFEDGRFEPVSLGRLTAVKPD